MNNAIYTICNIAYLPRALALSESVMDKSGERVHIIIFDKKRELNIDYKHSIITWLEDYHVPMYKQLAFKYDVVEFATALRPWFAAHFLKLNDKVIYLDPDMIVYDNLNGILNDLEKHPIILTPHYISPQNPHERDSDLALMRFGVYNLGFFALRKDEESFDFLEWLSNRCYHLCYSESQFGLGTDQKWVSIAPCFFPNIHVSRNLGYNAAYWNMHERQLSKVDNKYYINDTTPLIFFHFSAFDQSQPNNLSKSISCIQIEEQRVDIIELSNQYLSKIKKYDIENIDKKYEYDHFSNGRFISPTLRRAYASIEGELPEHDPFDENGVVYKFARKNNLLVKEVPLHKSEGYQSISEYKSQFILVTFVMRLILRFLGPFKFMNFSRLLVFISSYRQYRSLWKL